MTAPRLLLCGLALVALTAADRAPPTERYSILDGSGGPAGTIEVRRDRAGYRIDWDKKNNGRGNETHERLTLDADGLPGDWRIETKTDLGGIGGSTAGQGLTRFRREGDRAEWTIDGKAGTATVHGRALFAPADASPWAMGVYARALLREDGLTLPALPAGTLRLSKIGDETVAGVPLRTYSLEKPDHSRETLRLDQAGTLVAIGDGQVVVAGREAVAKALRDAVRARETAAAEALQRTLLHSFDTPVRIRNVRIFDPRTGTLGSAASLVFFGDRITAIEPLAAADRPGETVIDGDGGTLLPGFHDTHYHAGLSGPEGGWMSLAAGITTGRDMGSGNDFLQSYRKAVAAGRLPGPRIIPSGLIEGESAFSLKSTGVIAASQAQALEAVHWYAEHGYWQIKLYNSINPAWVPAIAREAHALGLRVAGHIPAFTTPDAMIAAGYDEITHANQLMLGWVLKPGEDTRTPLRLTAMSRFATLDLDSAPVRATLDMMQAKGIAFEPTLAIMRRLLTNRTGQVEPADTWWFDHLPKPFRPGHMITVLPGFTIMPIKTPADDATYNAAAAKMIELVGKMNRRGIRVFPGSDDNDGFVYQRELELFVAAGMTPAQALRRATLDTADYLGHAAEWGTIERGKSADFLLVAGDPVADIRAIHKVRMTVAQGRVYYPSEIYRALGIAPFAPPPTVRRKD